MQHGINESTPTMVDHAHCDDGQAHDGGRFGNRHHGSVDHKIIEGEFRVTIVGRDDDLDQQTVAGADNREPVEGRELAAGLEPGRIADAIKINVLMQEIIRGVAAGLQGLKGEQVLGCAAIDRGPHQKTFFVIVRGTPASFPAAANRPSNVRSVTLVIPMTKFND